MRNHPRNAAGMVFSILLAMIAMALPASAMNWQEDMDPANLRGSFYSTCSECRVDANGYLHCRCINNDGRLSRRSSVALGSCNRNGPNNMNGKLTCFPIVRGSWANSCRLAVITDNVLYADCKNISGDEHRTMFPLDRCPSMNLENIDGRLRCAQ